MFFCVAASPPVISDCLLVLSSVSYPLSRGKTLSADQNLHSEDQNLHSADQNFHLNTRTSILLSHTRIVCSELTESVISRLVKISFIKMDQ